MILIGRRALTYYYQIKEPLRTKDYDFIATQSEVDDFIVTHKPESVIQSPNYKGKYKITSKGRIIEIDATDSESNKILFYIMKKTNPIYVKSDDLKYFVPSLNVLYLTKRSHANFNVHIWKTLKDIALISKYIDKSSFTEDELRYYETRKNEAKLRYGDTKRKIRLNVKNDDFFASSQKLRKYEHDTLHIAVAFNRHSPMYERCKNDLDSAKIEKSLFDSLPYEDKLRMVQEEAMVIGLERFYIDKNKINDPVVAYRMGLSKLISDLCKGWFQDFAIDNIENLMDPSWDYISQFEEGVNTGIVKEISK